jgi:asparagine synthase (glutamine-hydrolysing)
MHRYVVFTWNETDEPARRQAQRLIERLRSLSTEWRCALSAHGIAAFHIPPSNMISRCYVLPDKQGLIFGILFPISEDCVTHPLSQLPDSFSAQDLFGSKGSSLASSYWGYYAAFAHDRSRNRHYAYRDISGRLSCFYTENGRVRVFFSHFADVARADVLPVLSINWQFLATYLYLNEPRIAEGGFHQVRELVAGEAIETNGTACASMFPWDPRKICRLPPIDDYALARSKLREMTEHCINAWASVHRRIVHQLSGGFDSAVVLGCLARVPKMPSLTCINRYAGGGDEDERPYARAAARRSACELVEIDWTAGGLCFDERLFSFAPIARPSLFVLMIPELEYRAALASRHGAVIWSGEGGDHLFMESQGVPFAADYAVQRGVTPQLLRLMTQNARYSGVSLWNIAREIYTSGFGRGLWKPEKHARGTAVFVNREFLPPAVEDYASHPWFFDQADLPTGKQRHVHDYVDVLNREPPSMLANSYEHHPLLSQPLMELCLRIPTYFHLVGGRNRALAHDAFRDHIPNEIFRRESKGGTTTLAVRLLTAATPFIRNALLDGVLTRERLVDRPTVDRILRPGRPYHPEHLLPIMACLACEIWARSAEELQKDNRMRAQIA